MAADGTPPSADEQKPLTDGAQDGSDSQKQTTKTELIKKRDAAQRLKSRYQSQLRGLTASASKPTASDSAPEAASELASPTEGVFRHP